MPVKKNWLHRLFYNDKFVVVFSLLAAFGLWLMITVAENPVREKNFKNLSISIDTAGTTAEDLALHLISTNHTTANVKISAPSYVLASLDPNDITVSANLTDVTESGKKTLTLSAVCESSSEVKVLSISPATVDAVFDYRDTKQYEIEIEALGASAVSGLVVDTPVVSNSAEASISITGPRAELEKISRVVAQVDVNAVLETSRNFDAEIFLYDAEGKTLDKTAFNIPTNTVKVTVPILKQKTVPLVVTFSNVPEYYSERPISNTASVSQITILGPESTMADIDSISLSPIDFDLISVDNTKFQVSPILPNGVKISGNLTTVTVDINISNSGFSTSVFDVNNFEFKNIADGYKVTAPAVNDVKICGPRNIVRNLKSADLYAVADLSGKTTGEYTVTVRIYSKKNNNIWQVGKYNVVVTIK